MEEKPNSVLFRANVSKSSLLDPGKKRRKGVGGEGEVIGRGRGWGIEEESLKGVELS